jgi:hypothetical protein
LESCADQEAAAIKMLPFPARSSLIEAAARRRGVEGERAMVGNREIRTVTVIGSQVLARPDQRCAILLDTQELGPIAFDINQNIIDTLRLNLTNAEQFLRPSTGHA